MTEALAEAILCSGLLSLMMMEKKANCDSVLGWGLEKYDKKMGDLSHTRHHHPTLLGWIFLTNATYYMVEAQFLFRHLNT